jgi:hypothetical protein
MSDRSCTHQQFARTGEPGRAFELAQGDLDLGPRRVTLGLGEGGEHLVESSERLPLQARALRRIGELTFWVGVRAIVAAVLLGVGLVVYLLDRSTSDSAAGVWIFLVIISIGMIAYRALRARRPWLRHTIGVYDETTLQDLLGGSPGPSPDHGIPGS